MYVREGEANYKLAQTIGNTNQMATGNKQTTGTQGHCVLSQSWNVSLPEEDEDNDHDGGPILSKNLNPDILEQ